MQCTCVREDILEPLVLAEKTTGKNHTLPVLSCVLLNVTGTQLTITATNLEVGVRYTVPIQNGKNGSAAVLGSTLAQTINTLPAGSSITFSVEGNHLTIRCAGGQSKIALHDTAEFPILPTVQQGTTITTDAHVLATAITQVSLFASNSVIKPELSSVYVHFDGGVLVTVATDSFRLAEKRIPLQTPVSADPFLIPIRSVPDLLKILERTHDTITISLTEHQLSVDTPNAYITMRLTSGTFPDYTQIIPKTFITEATLLTADFDKVLRRAAVFTDQFNQTTLSLNPKKKQFSIHTQHATVGETTDSISAALSGDELTIKFNQRYLLDALHSIYTDSISLQFAGQSNAAIIRPVGDTTFLYLVMPMNR